MKKLKDNILLVISWIGLASFTAAGFIVGFTLKQYYVGFYHLAAVCIFIAWNENRPPPPESHVYTPIWNEEYDG